MKFGHAPIAISLSILFQSGCEPQATTDDKACCACLSSHGDLLGSASSCETARANREPVQVLDGCNAEEDCGAECGFTPSTTCPDDRDRTCCSCLLMADLLAPRIPAASAESCAKEVARGVDPLNTGRECIAYDLCGPECHVPLFQGTAPTCGDVDQCCACLDGRTYIRSSGSVQPCMDTSANACAVRVRSGEDIPLNSTVYQENIDQCLIDACRGECRGFPPSP